MSEWISVKDRLPDNYERVLVCGVLKCIMICRYLENGNYGGYLSYMFLSDKQEPVTVTHWMPLPELPEEVKR